MKIGNKYQGMIYTYVFKCGILNLRIRIQNPGSDSKSFFGMLDTDEYGINSFVSESLTKSVTFSTSQDAGSESMTWDPESVPYNPFRIDLRKNGEKKC